MRQIPAATDPRWRAVVTGQKKLNFQLIAASVVVIQATLDLTEESTEEDIMDRATELRNIFVKNSASPRAVADLAQIFG